MSPISQLDSTNMGGKELLWNFLNVQSQNLYLFLFVVLFIFTYLKESMCGRAKFSISKSVYKTQAYDGAKSGAQHSVQVSPVGSRKPSLNQHLLPPRDALVGSWNEKQRSQSLTLCYRIQVFLVVASPPHQDLTPLCANLNMDTCCSWVSLWLSLVNPRVWIWKHSRPIPPLTNGILYHLLVVSGVSFMK